METSLIDKVLTTEIVCTYCSSVSNPLSQPRRTRDTLHAPEGARPPSGNAKDALDTVA